MKRKKNWLCILSALLLLASCPLPVFGAEEGQEDKDVTMAPYFFIQDTDPSVDRFPLKETKVSTTINGVIAETYVTQTYANEGMNPINASYIFPANTEVTVHGMKMEIGDQVITAKIKEKEEAKVEFEEAKTEGKSASLLEEQRPNVFSMSVANIMPGDTVKIELHYTELIISKEGTYEFMFPTVVGPRYVSPFEDNSSEAENSEDGQWVASPYLKDGDTPPGKYDISVKLSTGVPITDITCKSHKVNVKQDGEAEASVTLSDPEDYAGNRDFILNYKLTGETISSGLMLNRGETENFYMLMVQPPKRVAPETIPPREYIFVLDVSGSMEGYPIDTAKLLINDLVSNLKETDKFNLILFAGDSMQMAPASLPATKENIDKAINLIDQQNGGGGTELTPALENAIALPKDDNVSRNIVIITDGYIYEENEIFDLINKNMSTTSFFSFGIGSSVNRYLIDGIAKTGLGESFVVTDSADAENTAKRFRTYIEAPVLTDIEVSYDGFDVYDTQPDVLPTLFAQKPIVLFGKWKGEPTGTIHITGKSGNEEYAQDISVSDIAPLESNEAIKYLWARTKVERLTDYSGTLDSETVKQEVTELGLNYSMMTPYTSFIAVTETIRNENQGGTDVSQPLPLPLNVSNAAIGGYTTGSEPGELLLLFGAAAVLILCSVSRCRKRRSVSQ